MSANAIRAGRAFVELFADDSKLTRGLRAAQAKLKAFGAGVTSIGSRLTALGTAALAPLLAASVQFSQQGDSVHKMALRTGATAEALSELGFAAGQSGSDLATVEIGLRKLAAAIDDAIRGSKTATETLARFGLTAAQLRALTPDQQIEALADRLVRITDPGERAALALDLFGRSGTQLLPLLGEGASAVRALREQARQLGLTMRTEDAAAAADFNDALGELWAQVKALTFQIGAAVAGPLTDWIRKSQESIAEAISWTRENRELIVTAAAAAAGVLALGVVFTVAGRLITVAAAAVTLATTVLSAITAVVAVVKAAILALATATTVAGAAMAALQLGMMAGAVAAAATVAWFVKSALAAHDWSQSIGLGKQAWGALQQALGEGDLQRAGEIAFGGLKLLWFELVAALKLKWSEVHQSISETVAAAKDLVTFGNGARVAQQIAQHQTERSEIRRGLQAERDRYAALLAQQRQQTSADPQSPSPVPQPLRDVEDDFASGRREREKVAGTLSALSDRMFAQNADGTWKRLDTIAVNTRNTVAAIRGLSRLGMTYTR